MKYYHGTPIENLDSILTEGLKPFPNWDSNPIPVISLTISPEKALKEAYIVDCTNVSGGQKKFAKGYASLEVDASSYKIEKWQVDETCGPKGAKGVFSNHRGSS